MFIKLYKGILSDFNDRYKGRKDRIEGILESLGFVYYGSNFAQWDCSNLVEMQHMIVRLRELGFNGGEVGWA